MFNQKTIEVLENIWHKYKDFQCLEQWKQYQKNIEGKKEFTGKYKKIRLSDRWRMADAPFLVTYQINQYSRIKTRRFNTFKGVEKFIKNLHKKNIWLHNVWKIDIEYRANMEFKYGS